MCSIQIFTGRERNHCIYFNENVPAWKINAFIVEENVYYQAKIVTIFIDVVDFEEEILVGIGDEPFISHHV